jgi:hypothetical protein
VSIAHRQETIRSAQRVIRIGSDERLQDLARA